MGNFSKDSRKKIYGLFAMVLVLCLLALPVFAENAPNNKVEHFVWNSMETLSEDEGILLAETKNGDLYICMHDSNGFYRNVKSKREAVRNVEYWAVVEWNPVDDLPDTDGFYVVGDIDGIFTECKYSAELGFYTEDGTKVKILDDVATWTIAPKKIAHVADDYNYDKASAKANVVKFICITILIAAIYGILKIEHKCIERQAAAMVANKEKENAEEENKEC